MEEEITKLIKNYYSNVEDIRIQDFIKNIKTLENTKEYNVDKLLEAINHQLKNLNYYYGTLCKKKGEEYITYIVNNIKEHTLIYVNLGRGFPKEIMDGHWCYVLKILGAKAIIIPTTSKKKKELNMYEIDIDIDIHGKKSQSILKLSDLRTIDTQRIYKKREQEWFIQIKD